MSAGKRSRLVLFDVDGTLFRGQSQRLVLRLAREAGLVGYLPFATLILWFALYRLGIVRRTEAIRTRAVRLFRGVEVAAVEGLVAHHADRFLAHLRPEICGRLVRHRAEGDEVVLVSAALEPIVQLIAGHLGVATVVATRLEVAGGRYTGRIAGRAVYGTGKVAMLEGLLTRANKTGRPTVYYTDDASDLPLLHRVDQAVCVHPGGRLRAVAAAEGWQVVTTEA